MITTSTIVDLLLKLIDYLATSIYSLVSRPGQSPLHTFSYPLVLSWYSYLKLMSTVLVRTNNEQILMYNLVTLRMSSKSLRVLKGLTTKDILYTAVYVTMDTC